MHKLLLSAAILSFAAGPALAQPMPQGPGEGQMHHEMMHHEMWMHMMRGQQGDSFRFKKGDQEIDIHCSAEQPIQACVEAASRIMQQVKSMGQSSSSSSGDTSGTSSGTSGTSGSTGH